MGHFRVMNDSVRLCYDRNEHEIGLCLTPAQGRTLNTVPQPLMNVHGWANLPPAGVVPHSKSNVPRIKPALGKEPSPPLPVKLWSTVSVQVPPCVGGVSSKTVPQPELLPQFPPVPPFRVVP